MNHLAHLFLAGDTTESLIGNLAGDFVRGTLADRFEPGIRQGILEHRRIDVFTDTHPATGAMKELLVAEYRHYTPVITDMFCDHFLAARFEEFAGEPLEDFLNRVFAQIDAWPGPLPGTLGEVYPHMRDAEWFLSYREVGGIRFALRQMSTRFSRRPQLHTAARHLTDSRAAFEQHFDALFPDVMAFARSLRVPGFTTEKL